MARTLPSCFLVLLLALAPSVASAQGGDESMDVEAHALFEAGRTAFAAGRFADALSHFQSAYELSHRPVLLYNIGQCHDRLRHDAEALTAFRGFLAGVPDSPQRTEVEARVAILEEALAHQTTAPPETAPPETPPEPAVTPESVHEEQQVALPPGESHDAGPGPWIVLGVGAAVVVAGAVLVGLAFADIAQVQNAMPGTDFSAVHDAYDQAPVLSGIGWAAIGVGAAMALGGVIWGVMGSSSSDAHAELRIVPGGLSLAGTF